MPTATFVRIFAPFWPANVYGLAAAPDAGVTFQTTVPHPFASTLGERYIKHQGDAARKLPLQAMKTAVDVGGSGESVGSGIREGLRISFLGRAPATAPGAQAILLSTPQWKLYENNDRTVTLEVGGVTRHTSVATIPTGTDYWWELWCIGNDRAGNPYPTSGGEAQGQWVFRYVDLSTRTPTEIFSEVLNRHAVVGANVVTFGETTARAAGYDWYTGNIYCARELADDAYGIIRCDRMDPNGASAHKNELTGNAPDVDETGTAVPDDTDSDSATIAALASARQLYTLTAPAYVVAADTVIRLQVHNRGGVIATSKQIGGLAATAVGDGTTSKQGLDTSSTAVIENNDIYKFDPAGGALAQGDLAGWESGIDLTSLDDDETQTGRVTVVSTFVIYQKSGETIAAPSYIAPAATAVVERAVMRGVGRGVATGVR